MKLLKSNLLFNPITVMLFGLFLYPVVSNASNVEDTIKPEIYLKGEPVMTVERFSVFNDPGVTAFDGQSGIEKINIVGEVDSALLGIPSIIEYTAIDKAGNKSFVKRTVNVVDTTSPGKVTNLTATTTFNSAVLTWGLPNDKDLASLNVYRSEVPGELGNLLISGFKSDKVTDSGLVSGKTYYYSVESVDDQGLTSPVIGISATTLVTTPVSNNTNVPQESVINSSTNSQSVIPDSIAESKEQVVLGSTSDNTEKNNETFFTKKVLGLKVWAWGAILLVAGVLGAYYFARNFIKNTR
jgi:hypothetical protein